jgi:N-acetylglucosamine kinase-like BadF-type ATPase
VVEHRPSWGQGAPHCRAASSQSRAGIVMTPDDALGIARPGATENVRTRLPCSGWPAEFPLRNKALVGAWTRPAIGAAGCRGVDYQAGAGCLVAKESRKFGASVCIGMVLRRTGGTAGLRRATVAAMRELEPKAPGMLAHFQRGAYDVIHFGIDAGGTTTRLVVRDDSGKAFMRTYPSLNPASVTDPFKGWNVALRAIAAHGRTLNGWIGSASVSKDSLASEAAMLKAAARNAGATGRVMLSNDMVPLLMGPPLEGVGTAITVGTGTSFLSRTAAGEVAAASGYEYLISDEGGAFDIGLRGLRAAARAYDGRGDPTTMLSAAINLYGSGIPDLGRRLAHSARPKPEVSRFAQIVCLCAEGGDQVAAGVLASAVSAVMTGISAVRRRVHATTEPILLAGGVIDGCDAVWEGITEAARQEWPDASVLRAANAAESALALAERSASLSARAAEDLAGGLDCSIVTFGEPA